MSARVNARVQKLLMSHKKLTKRYKAMPNSAKKERMGKRILEIERSLKNFKEHGREVVSGGAPAVDVEVPVRDFNIRGDK